MSEIKSIFKGVTQGVLYKMKVIFVHFPTTVKVEDQKVRIDNFLGERAPRYAKVFPGVEIKVNKQDIELKGVDPYAVSQSAANIEQACKITKRDRRVFQDGVYITYKDSE
jgi:large subunit ribosomal protein L6